MSSLDGVIAKIQALRARTKSDNVHEASTCAALADALIQKHGLSEEQLKIKGGPVDDQDPLVTWERHTPAWQLRLAIYLARHYNCATYILKYTPEAKPKGKRRVKSEAFHLVGLPDDIRVTRYMFSWLVVEIERLAQAARKGEDLEVQRAVAQLGVLDGFPPPHPGQSYINSFRHGAVVGIAKALDESKEKARVEATSMALAIYDDKLAQAEEKMREPGDIEGEREWEGASDPRAFGEGHRAGESLHRGKGLGDGSGARMKALGGTNE